jgi:hypothetical protein
MMDSFISDSQSVGLGSAPRCIALSVVSHIPFFPIYVLLQKGERKSHAATGMCLLFDDHCDLRPIARPAERLS